MLSDSTVLYRGKDSPSIFLAPFFFYHIPKCAGMLLHHMANCAWATAIEVGHIPATISQLVRRIDNLDFRKDAQTDTIIRQMPYVFLATHLPYGFHETLHGNPRLITLLRDPVARVCSAYTYQNMRAEIPVSLDEMRDYFPRESNRNIMTKILAGLNPDTPATPEDLQRSKEHLLKKFSLFGTTEDISAICESYLQACGLPNVITGMVNQTIDEYRLAARKLEKDIGKANELDMKLYEFVRRNKRTSLSAPSSPSTSTKLHRLTIFIVEQSSAKESVVRPVWFDTAFLSQAGVLGKGGKLNRTRLKEFIKIHEIFHSK